MNISSPSTGDGTGRPDPRGGHRQGPGIEGEGACHLDEGGLVAELAAAQAGEDVARHAGALGEFGLPEVEAPHGLGDEVFELVFERDQGHVA